MREERKSSQNVVHVCSLRRVTRVTKGGKEMKFSALVVSGDSKGRVGFGLGKSVDVSEAIKKASRVAEKKMIFVPFKNGRTIYHDVSVKFGSAKVYLRSAKAGRGVIAGGSMRYIFEALGIKDIVCKSVGSCNPHNVVKATFNALYSLRSPKLISKIRGVELKDMFAIKESE